MSKILFFQSLGSISEAKYELNFPGYDFFLRIAELQIYAQYLMAHHSVCMEFEFFRLFVLLV